MLPSDPRELTSQAFSNLKQQFLLFLATIKRIMNPDVRYNSPIVNAKNTAFSILMLVFFLADSTFGRTATMRVIELGRERVKQEDYIKSGNVQSCNQHWRHCKE